MNKASVYIKEHQSDVNQRYKPSYHLAPPIGWMNDPNGFVYYQGEYHLFYQHYPYESLWGPMHWGHAKSTDLLHWDHLPVALEPLEAYEAGGCFSGSAIEKDGRLYLMYTGHYDRDGVKRETQCIAVSDDGTHFEKYSGNPVIDGKHIEGIADSADFRDPKVFEREGLYYCVVASKTSDNRGQILLFKSIDLLKWEFVSVLLEGTAEQGIMWECPDLFELDGKDVLIMSPIQIPKEGYQYDNTSSTVAFIGYVDWKLGKFIVENYHEIDFGMDFYAPQTCLNQQNQRLMVAWMQMWDRTMPTHDLNHGWVGAMTLPRRLSVRNNRLIQEPIGAIKDYGEQGLRLENRSLKAQLKEIIPDVSRIKLIIEVNDRQPIKIKIGNQTENLSLVYDKATAELTLDRSASGYDIIGSEALPVRSRRTKVQLIKNILHLDLYLDKCSIEVFANQAMTMTSTFYPKTEGLKLMIESDGQSEVKELVVNRIEL